MEVLVLPTFFRSGGFVAGVSPRVKTRWPWINLLPLMIVRIPAYCKLLPTPAPWFRLRRGSPKNENGPLERHNMLDVITSKFPHGSLLY